MNSDDEHAAADVAWEGDSLAVLRSFPKRVRSYLGADLRRLQLGETPHDSRPMKTIGNRVFELRQQDARGWYRLVYLAKIENTIYVLHCFEKHSRKTPRRDLEIAKSRLKFVRVRLLKGKGS
jgi:phage-related protein